MKIDFKNISKILILLPILSMLLVGCKKEEETAAEDRQYYYDPKIPFGNINLNTAKIKNVENLAADASVLNKIKLTWRVPPIYTTLPHKVMIYKRREAPEGFDLTCPKPASSFTSLCPADEASAAPIYLYKEVNANLLLDQNELDANGDEINNVDLDMGYSYWVFMKVNDNDWSTGVRIDVRSKSKGSSFQLPPPAKFWEYKRWSLGYDPINNGTVHYLQSLQPGIPSPGVEKGGIALAFSGNVLYVADTDNNRVVLYSRSGALSCEQYTDEYEKSACLLQFLGAPLVAVNVLGQSAPGNNYACGGPYEKVLAEGGDDDGICEGPMEIISAAGGDNDGICEGPMEINLDPGGDDDGICEFGESCTAQESCTVQETCENNPLPQNECLTKPSKVSVVGTRLFISDSGNNRIVVHNNLPLNGCITNNGSGNITPRECTPNWVIGKSGLLDTATYNLAATGDAILNNPTDVVANEGSLYVADSGNNRVIKIENYFDRDQFDCNPDTWGTPLCKFDAVLGQPDFFTDDTFGSLVAANPGIIAQTGIKDTLHPDYANILKRYFRHPNRIVFTEDGKMLIGANEQFSTPNAIGGKSALHARIMIFNTNPIAANPATCNAATFDTGDCDANESIGQGRFDKLATVTDDSPASYNTIQEAMFSLDDFDLLKLPSEVEGEDGTELIMGLSSVTNEVFFWNNWVVKSADGYPKSNKAIDPVGAPHPSTGQLMPDLKNLCSIRISEVSTNIYVTDCGGNRVHEIQAADYIPTN